MTLAKYKTVKEIVVEACKLMSLSRPAVVVSSSDVKVVQVLAAMVKTGKELTSERAWQGQIKEWTIPINPLAPGPIPLPTDFNGFIPETAWNRTTRLPLWGPQTPQAWQMLKALGFNGTAFNVAYRIQNDALLLQQYPSTAQTMTVEYYSNGWLQSATDSSVYLLDPASDGDRVLLDDLLVIHGTRLAYLENKGFDSTVAKRDYDMRLVQVAGRDEDAPVLSLSRRSRYPYLGVNNIPITNFGQ